VCPSDLETSQKRLMMADCLFNSKQLNKQSAIINRFWLVPAPAAPVCWLSGRFFSCDLLSKPRPGGHFHAARPWLPSRWQISQKDGSLYPERSEEHTSELQSRFDLVCRLLLEKKNSTSRAMS